MSYVERLKQYGSYQLKSKEDVVCPYCKNFPARFPCSHGESFYCITPDCEKYKRFVCIKHKSMIYLNTDNTEICRVLPDKYFCIHCKEFSYRKNRNVANFCSESDDGECEYVDKK